GNHVADRHPASTEDVLDHVQAFDHLGPTLAQHLAAFASHQLSELVHVALDELGEIVEEFSAVDSAGTSPGGECGASGADGLIRLLRATTRENAEDLVLVRRAATFKLRPRRRLPATGDQVTTGNGGKG